MQTISTIGLDIAKSVFQVHGVDAVGQVVIRRQLKRRHLAKISTMACAGQISPRYKIQNLRSPTNALLHPGRQGGGPFYFNDDDRVCHWG
jgi:hypothetical protein